MAFRNRLEEAAKIVLRCIEETCLLAKLLGPLVRRQNVTEDMSLWQEWNIERVGKQRLEQCRAGTLRACDDNQFHATPA